MDNSAQRGMPPERNVGRYQFSLRWLVVGTVVIAVLLSVARLHLLIGVLSAAIATGGAIGRYVAQSHAGCVAGAVYAVACGALFAMLGPAVVFGLPAAKGGALSGSVALIGAFVIGVVFGGFVGGLIARLDEAPD